MTAVKHKKTVAVSAPVDHVGLGIDENGLPYTIDENGTKQIISNLEFAAEVIAALSKSTFVNEDLFGIVDSEDENVIKQLSGTALKAALKTYFDTIYSTFSGAHNDTTGKQLAASGVIYGHIDDQSQTIAGVKSYPDGINGGTGSGDDLTIESTSNATKGHVVIQPNGGSMGLGGASTPEFLTTGSSIGITSSGQNSIAIDHTDVAVNDYIGAIEYQRSGNTLAAISGLTSSTSTDKGVVRVLTDDGTGLSTAFTIDEVGKVSINKTPSTATVTHPVLYRNPSTGAIEQLAGGIVANEVHNTTGKTTPVDSDELGVIDSAASYVLKKLTWANLKATLKTYFDTLYNNYVLTKAAVEAVLTGEITTHTHPSTVSQASTTSASSITPTGDKRENEYFVTALATGLTINAPSGTPANGNTLLIRIYGASSQTLTLNSIFVDFTGNVPASTVAGKDIYLSGVYNSRTSKWNITGYSEEP